MFLPFERLQLPRGFLDSQHSHSTDGFPHIFAVFVRLKMRERLRLLRNLLSVKEWIGLLYGQTDLRKKNARITFSGGV